MSELPELVSVTADASVPGTIHFRISSFEKGAVVDLQMSRAMALLAVKVLMNAIAGAGELPDDQRV